MSTAVGHHVSLVVATDEGTCVATGTLMARTANELVFTLGVDVVLEPGEAAVAVVHDESVEVLLVVGVAGEADSDHLRVRVVQRRS